jgi:outer membrane protein assembly factor BamB
VPGVSEKFYSSPAAGDGKLFFISEQGKAVVVRAGNSDWEVLSVTDLGEDVFATPAIATDGRIYVRTAESLRCFRSPARQGLLRKAPRRQEGRQLHPAPLRFPAGR